MKMLRIVSLMLIALMLAAPATLDAKTRKASTTRKTATHKAATTSISVAQCFSSSQGKYAYETGLLKKPAVKARLTKLLGVSLYNYMIKNFQTQGPIRYADGCYHVWGMKSHSGNDPGFNISYNVGADALGVEVLRDDHTEVYKEKPEVFYYFGD